MTFSSFGIFTCYLGRCANGKDPSEGPKHRHRGFLFPLCERNFLIFSQCLSGRGDKDVEQISQLLPGKWADILDWHISESDSL